MVTTIALLAGLIVLLLLASMLVRRPTTGSWHDIEAPVRVPRGSTASVRIGIEIQGPATWVRCTGTQTRRVAPVVEWPISTRRRGLQLVGPTALEFANPFGLGRRTLATRESSRVLVVPQISPAPVWLPTHGHATADGRERQGSELFDSLRAYASGDPMNSVHWRSSARTGQLMVRRMVETTVPSLMVVLDVEAAAYDRTRSGFRDFDPDSFEAAHQAPSVGLMQPWRFIRISDRQLRSKVQALVEEERVRTAEALGERSDEFMTLKVEGINDCAEVLVAALMDDREKHIFGRRTLPEMDMASLSCAIQNLWLAARVEGLGMGWVSLFEPRALAELLGLPAGAKPLAVLCLGPVESFYPAPMLILEGWAKARPLSELVYENYWGVSP